MYILLTIVVVSLMCGLLIVVGINTHKESVDDNGNQTIGEMIHTISIIAIAFMLWSVVMFGIMISIIDSKLPGGS